MAANTIGKGVNGMGHIAVDDFVAEQALLGTCSLGLILGWRHPQLMNIVAGSAGDSLPCVGRFFPVIELHVPALGKSIGIKELVVVYVR